MNADAKFKIMQVFSCMQCEDYLSYYLDWSSSMLILLPVCVNNGATSRHRLVDLRCDAAVLDDIGRGIR